MSELLSRKEPSGSVGRRKLAEVTNCVATLHTKLQKNVSAASLKSGSQKAASTIVQKSKQFGSAVSIEAQTAFSKIAQKFRSSTRRRQVLENAYTPVASGKVKKSPGRARQSPGRVKQILGRTPTKMYSPFTIETPQEGRNSEPEYLRVNPSLWRPTDAVRRSPRFQNSRNLAKLSDARFYSPTGHIQNDVNSVRESLAHMELTVNKVVRRSLRKQLDGK